MGLLGGEYEPHCQIRDIRWLITTSPRTGKDVEKLLASVLAPEAIADAVWYDDQPRPVIPAYLGAASQIFCTEDSMSMLSEAIHADKPVISLQPEKCERDARYETAIQKLALNGWVTRESVTGFSGNVSPARSRATPDATVTDPRRALWRQVEHKLKGSYVKPMRSYSQLQYSS